MILFPAIDLKDGVCVRLKKGVMEDATIFNTDPAAQAKSFEAQGFEWLHCVDLNGAFAGKSANSDAIRAIRAAIDLPIQLGGGIRDTLELGLGQRRQQHRRENGHDGDDHEPFDQGECHSRFPVLPKFHQL